jgi:hypothetical protein
VALHVLARDCDGVEALAPPQPIKRTSELFGIYDFTINMKSGSAMCPDPARDGRSLL